jgi:hypothetical protein
MILICIIIEILFILSLVYLIVNKHKENYGENNVRDILNDYKPMTYKGSDVSGSVWLNNDYNVAVEDPGLSWVL